MFGMESKIISSNATLNFTILTGMETNFIHLYIKNSSAPENTALIPFFWEVIYAQYMCQTQGWLYMRDKWTSVAWMVASFVMVIHSETSMGQGSGHYRVEKKESQLTHNPTPTHLLFPIGGCNWVE